MDGPSGRSDHRVRLTFIAIEHVKDGTGGARKEHVGDEQHAVSKELPEPLARRGRTGRCFDSVAKEQHEGHRDGAQRLEQQTPVLVDARINASCWHADGEIEEREGVETADHATVNRGKHNKID